MKCAMCFEGRTEPGRTKLLIERGATTVVIKDIPAEVCTNCGQAYIGADTMRRLERIVEDAVSRGVEMDVLRFAA